MIICNPHIEKERKDQISEKAYSYWSAVTDDFKSAISEEDIMNEELYQLRISYKQIGL